MQAADAINSPFKFLRPYQKEDINYFFGRKSETEELYEFVNRNRIVLVYGQSGTGKTSLIQCGLANLFEPTDWIPVFIRRKADINRSLIRELKAMLDPEPPAIEEEFDGENYLQELSSLVQQITAHYLRPVFLIFDQFEEVLILGSEKEKEYFIEALKDILVPDHVLSCHVIMVMREEYFAYLDEFEKKIPGLCKRRLRVEKMREAQITEVIRESFMKFNIVTDNLDAISLKIITLFSKKTNFSLPYLQVYLDQLWMSVYTKTFGTAPATGNPPLKITLQDITNLGNIDTVFQNFFNRQRSEVQRKLKAEYPELPGRFLNELLNRFVSREATRLSIPYTITEGVYKFKEPGEEINDMGYPDAIKAALNYLEGARILINDGNSIELAHDSLAKVLDSEKDASEKRLTLMTFNIKNAYAEHKITPTIFLSYDLVKKYEEDINKIVLKPEEINFFNASRKTGRQQEFRVEMNERKRRRYKLLMGLTTAIAIIISIAFIIGLKTANSFYAQVYSAYTVDSLPTKVAGLRASNYLHKFRYKQDSVNPYLESKILALASDQGVQDNFGNYTYTRNSPRGLMPGEVDMSFNGRYVLVRNDESSNTGNSPVRYDIVDTREKKVLDTITDILYGYFLGRSDSLLLVKNSINDRAYKELGDNLFIYNCNQPPVQRPLKFSAIPYNSYLYDFETVFKYKNGFHDNFSIRLTANGNLIMPALEICGSTRQPKLCGRMIIIKGRDTSFIPSAYSVMISKDKRHLLVDKKLPDGKIEKVVYDESFSKSLFTFHKNWISDFTDDGRVAYIKNDSICIADYLSKPLEKFPVNMQLSSISSGGDLTVGLSGDNKILVLNTTTGKTRLFEEEFIGANFAKQHLFTMVNKAGRNPVIYSHDLSRNRLDSFSCPLPIESFAYNQQSNHVLLLTRKNNNTGYQYLLLIDDSLNRKTALALTANDSYGFSGDGAKFYYVRDKSLTSFTISDQLPDMLNFEKMKPWIDSFPDLTRDELNKFHVRFPSQYLWFR